MKTLHDVRSESGTAVSFCVVSVNWGYDMLRKHMMGGLAAGMAMMALAPAADATVFVNNTYHIGDMPHFYLTSGTPFTQSITANFGDGFSSAVTFDDKFEFTIPQNGLGSGSISTSFSSKNNKLVITDLLINGVHFVVPANGSGQFLAVSNIPILFNVLNTIEVIGTTSKLGGTYSGTATFSATAVPEAASWAMMLAGFGLVGAAMRKRRTSLTFA